jgi:putative transcriptional regulator
MRRKAMPIKFHLKKILAINEMTQKELSVRTGIRPPTISAICNNSVKHIPVDVLEKICHCLNCQPGDIIEYIEIEHE